MAEGRLVSVTIDCAEVEPVVRFYEQLLGLEQVADDPGWAQLARRGRRGHRERAGRGRATCRPCGPRSRASRPRCCTSRSLVDDLDAAVAVAVSAGGTEAPWQPPDRDPDRIRIVLDPAGHPLCLFLDGE